MNNDLEKFSEEDRKALLDTCRHIIGRVDKSVHSENLRIIAGIALSAMQAKPVAEIRQMTSGAPCFYWLGNDCELPVGTLLYTTPQPAHTEQSEMPDKALSLSETIGELRKYINSSGCYNFEALRSEQVNSPVIPDGWKLVPEEATIAMLTLLGMTGSFEFMQQKYKNMLAAAPKPESE